MTDREPQFEEDRLLDERGNSVVPHLHSSFHVRSETYMPRRKYMNGHWMKPSLTRTLDGGCLLLGPLQFNWYNQGFRIHVTWPFQRTLTLW